MSNKKGLVSVTRQDLIDNFQELLKETEVPGNEQSTKKLQSLSKKEINHLIIEYGKLIEDIIVAMPLHEVDKVNLGFGSIKVVTKDPAPYRDFETGEMKLSKHAGLCYFKPSKSLRHKMSTQLSEHMLEKERILKEQGRDS